MLSEKQHIVFDLDGTIIASTPFYLSILERIFASHGLCLDDGAKREAMGLSARSFLESRLTAPDLSRSIELIRSQSENDLDVIPLFNGMKNLLHGLFRRGVRMAVWTSRDSRSAKSLLHRNGLDSLFDLLVSADCVTRHKPDPEGLHFISRQWKCPIKEIVMIGDHDVDMIAAKSVGALPIRANWHGFSPGLYCHVGAMTMHSVDTLAEAFHA